MDIKLTQMEFDFSEPQPPESPKKYTVELTRGWDGETTHSETIVGLFAEVSAWLRRRVLKDPCVRRYWTYTERPARADGSKVTIVDFGSYTNFARIITSAEPVSETTK